MSNGKPEWCGTCARVLRIDGPNYTNLQVAARIETETGKRFSEFTVSRHRAAMSVERCRRNDWSAPLRRWKAQHAQAA